MNRYIFEVAVEADAAKQVLPEVRSHISNLRDKAIFFTEVEKEREEHGIVAFRVELTTRLGAPDFFVGVWFEGLIRDGIPSLDKLDLYALQVSKVTRKLFQEKKHLIVRRQMIGAGVNWRRGSEMDNFLK